jgi:hypothetical protein
LGSPRTVDPVRIPSYPDNSRKPGNPSTKSKIIHHYLSPKRYRSPANRFVRFIPRRFMGPSVSLFFLKSAKVRLRIGRYHAASTPPLCMSQQGEDVFNHAHKLVRRVYSCVETKLEVKSSIILVKRFNPGHPFNVALPEPH